MKLATANIEMEEKLAKATSDLSKQVQTLSVFEGGLTEMRKVLEVEAAGATLLASLFPSVLPTFLRVLPRC